MSTVELRNKIYDSLKSVEDSTVLEKVYSYIENIRRKNSNDNDIVAYTIKGKPLTKQEYIQQVKEADKSVSEGNYTTVEDLEKEVQNW
jgi:CRISPR/Cas system endoribonuclease Cas6 (RAMP superfamily)